MLTKDRIIEELHNLGVTPPEVVLYEETDSTNTRAKEWAKENPHNREPVVFIADGQTAGHGRRGRSFVSERGEGIYISFLVYPEASGKDATVITAESAVALSRAIASETNLDLGIKWVNDIYVNGKKLCGILVEGAMDSDGKNLYNVVGMGINVYKNAISNDISHIATSIEDALDLKISREKLIARIILEFLFGIKKFSGEEIYREYKARSIILNRQVKVIKIGEEYSARALDIEADYSLKIQLDNGDVERLFTGEVSLKLS